MNLLFFFQEFCTHIESARVRRARAVWCDMDIAICEYIFVLCFYRKPVQTSNDDSMERTMQRTNVAVVI